MTHAVVKKLVNDIQGKGHHVYMDNFFTSPTLFNDLRKNGLGACGTLRPNRRGVPSGIKEKVRKGERKAFKLDESMLAIKWMDKRPVIMLTTIHNNDIISTERRSRKAEGGIEKVEKPVAVAEYNKFMGGVDTADQFLSYYGFSHRTVRWWRRAFFFLLDMAVVNSYIIYTQKCTSSRRFTHEQFIIQLATDLLAAADVALPALSTAHHRSLHPIARLTERHFPTTIGMSDTGRHMQQDCAVCSKRKERGRKTTTYKCRECNLAMCMVPCFELYHTKKDPLRYI